MSRSIPHFLDQFRPTWNAAPTQVLPVIVDYRRRGDGAGDAMGIDTEVDEAGAEAREGGPDRRAVRDARRKANVPLAAERAALHRAVERVLRVEAGRFEASNRT